MAIVKFGGGVSGIRGTIAGNVFTAARNGPYIRPWSRVHNPKSLYQTINRMSASLFPSAWRALTSDQRDDWNTYGAAIPLTNALGETYYRTGWQWYFHCAQNLLVCGGTPPTDAPVDPAPATVVCTSFTYGTGGLFGYCKVEFDSDDFTGLWLVFQFRPIPYSGNMSCPSGYRLIGASFEPPDDQINPVLIVNAFFGPPQEGWRGFVRISAMDLQGLRSAPWQAQADWAP